MKKTIQIMHGAVTNGDVIRALFPNISVVIVFGGDIWLKVDNSYLQCSESWWGSLYKEKQDGCNRRTIRNNTRLFHEKIFEKRIFLSELRKKG